MDEATAVRSAKEKLLARTERAAWCAGVGIEKTDDALGLVLSVTEGSRSDAEKLLRGLRLPVPVRVREVGPIRARPRVSRAKAAPVSDDVAAKLRAAAARRRSV